MCTLLQKQSDRRLPQSDVYELDLFFADGDPLPTDQKKETAASSNPSLPAPSSSCKEHSGGGRKRLEGCTQVCERLYEFSPSDIRNLKDAGFRVRLIGQDVAEYYQSISGVVCIKARRSRYSLVERATGTETVVTAAAQPRFLPKTKVGDLFLADAVYGKYGMHLPWNRMEKHMALSNTGINRQDLDRYFLAATQRLGSLRGLFRKRLVQAKAIYADETPTVVQGSDLRKDYFWVFNASDVMLFSCPGGRSGEKALKDLRGYDGAFMCDGYAAYPAVLGKALLCVCMAHVRRPYADYRRSVGPEKAVGRPLGLTRRGSQGAVPPAAVRSWMN